MLKTVGTEIYEHIDGIDEEIKEIHSKSIISFGKINKYYIIPFIAPIFSTLRSYVIYTIKNDNEKIHLSFLFLILSGLAYSGCGLVLYIISNFNESKLDEKEQKKQSELREKNKFIFAFFIFIMAISPVLNLPFGFFAYSKDTLQNRYYCFLFIPIFSKFILNINIYRHQILSLFISFLGFIIFLILFIIAYEYSSKNMADNFRFLISCFFFALHMVLFKFLFNKYFYFSPSLCYILIGLFIIIITLIGSVFYSLFEFKNLSFFSLSFDFLYQNLGAKFYLLTSLNLVLHIIHNLFSFLVIYYFSPNLYIISDIFRPLLFWIIKTFVEENETKLGIIFKSIAYLIQLIAAIIYNEIIILNFCGLDKETNKCINERAREDSLYMRKNNKYFLEINGFVFKNGQSEDNSKIENQENINE